MRTAVTLAAVIIILAALKLAASIVVPVLIAIVFAVAFQPLTEVLAKRGVPSIVAAIITVIAVLLAIAALGTIAGIGVAGLAADAPTYAAQLRDVWQRTLDWLDANGLESVARGMATTDVGGRVSQIVQAGALWMSGAASDLLNVILLTAFIQLEATSLKRKLQLVTEHEGMSRAALTFESVQKYLRVKFMRAAMNGTLLGTWCALWGVSNPILWGVLAFALNFVPIIGSLIAAMLPILLTLVESGIGHALGVAAGYIAVNLAVDNMLEPRLMGRALDISPLVLLLSLLLWGFILGPVGALLSFPLTVALRIYCEQHPATRWIAIFLAARPLAEGADPANSAAQT